ncbi:Coenzyme F420 hydrogenase/dehydrogenase, beta subunit C-terminal domain [Aeromicrobium sp. 50.2.37]|uniref:Coenzyme F420 hydrogenase/dehydrogenase, beta subunit C-terminal domain n=1 Tax=Aeromicrobium sp. 50.2.37 TaxID=2969305 RepID=UPI00214FDA3E|nr:Coenzyme F420 hydrogenase/dehydrogenase, beta subunit C-terminal domain [Aeromicrobium sp. 50.2.37]MCR4513031.1 Coenzyme F420 hydrogenase/dehydrogenase, beta subunit C-terminal domain [Aeromicrobium sp. 50.2.37]
MTHRIEEVLSRGMCVGCGGCSVATRGAIPITISRRGIYEASLDGVSEEDRRAGSSVCPFSDESKNEDQLGPPAGEVGDYDPRLGRFTSIRAGRRTADETLPESSSGGITSWTLGRLLETGAIDGVIHVGAVDGDRLFEYVVSRSLEEIEDRRKSQYYATTLASTIEAIRGDGRRYAIVGVPCFIRTARNLADSDLGLRSQFAYYIGIVCGHLKSQFFAEAAAWQGGVIPSDLDSVDFRVKAPGRPAWDYSFGYRSESESELRTIRNLDLLGSNWGHGAFQPEACNFCDDIFAETADVVFGDAWIEPYQADWRGTNIIVSRSNDIDALLQEGAHAGDLTLDPVSADMAAESQAGNFRHRRDGLRVRLADDIDQGLSVPAKRVEPGREHVDARRLRIVRQRRRMSALSFELFERAKAAGAPSIYTRSMQREVDRYSAIGTPLPRRIARKIKAFLRR